MSQHDNSDSRLEASVASDNDIQAVHGSLRHDQKEPGSGYSLMPLFMLGFVSTMIFAVAIYFIHNRGGLDQGLALATTIHHNGYDPTKHGVEEGEGPQIDPIVAGQALYMQVCVACHLPTGQGLPMAFPPLVGSDWVTGDEERLIKLVLHGLQGPIEVNGNPFNGLMPAFGPTGTYNWSDDKLSYVLTYIRQEWGNEAGEITIDQVAAVRAATADQTSAYTAADLDQGLALATTIHHNGYDPTKHGVEEGEGPQIDPIVAGQALYMQVCVACHLPTGQGLPMAFPPLVGSDWVTGDEERLIKLVLHGLQGPIEVNGNPFNGLMPAFGPTGTYNWSDDKLSYVLTYIRQEWGNEAGEITIDQVAAVRAATADQTSAYTAADLN